MIHIISFENPRMAQAFVDYMAGQNIQLQLHPSNDQQHYELWLADEQHTEQVRQELETFCVTLMIPVISKLAGKRAAQMPNFSIEII